MNVIRKKQEFSGPEGPLHSTSKYRDAYSTELIYSINEAYHNIHTGNIAKLDKLVTFLEKNSNDPWVLTTLKSKDDLGLQHRSLLSNYQGKCVSYIKTCLDILDQGKHLNINSKVFNCPARFLNYLTKTRGNEYFPNKQVHNIKAEVIEKERELKLSKTLDLEL